MIRRTAGGSVLPTAGAPEHRVAHAAAIRGAVLAVCIVVDGVSPGRDDDAAGHP
jgi:hypothetical protein